MSATLRELLRPQRLTAVVDVGANPIDGDPPYRAMLQAGLCTVVGFEPQAQALERLQSRRGPLERYLPLALGDGGAHLLHECAAEGMTSLLRPDPRRLRFFLPFEELGRVAATRPVQTTRLDDADVGPVDFLKIDVQGSELAVLASGRRRLAEAVVVQTEVSFVPLYEGQPALGDIDRELRSQGFLPHAFAAVKRWPLAPVPARPETVREAHQLLEADLVYVRDFTRPEAMADEQLKHLAMVGHHCYGSHDLALRCAIELEKRGAVAGGTAERYRAGGGS